MSSFQHKVSWWNTQSYGNIFYRKKGILTRIEGIEKKLGMGRNRFLEDLQCDLWKDLKSILDQEELFLEAKG